MTLKQITASPSKTLASILAVFCFGILLGPLVPFVWWQGLMGLALILFIAGCIVTTPERRLLFFLLCIFVFGLFRFTQTQLPSAVPHVRDVSSSAIVVSGVVDAEVERRVDAQRVIIDQVHYANDTREGRVLVWLPLYPEVSHDDELIFNCRVQQPEAFNGFAYDKFLQVRNIGAVCYRPQYLDVIPTESWSIMGVILSFKNTLIQQIRSVLPEPHASYVSGLLFGGSTALSSELKTDFSRTGTSHILAASGFNVSLFSLAFLTWILGTRVGRKRGLILTTILLVLYVITAGMTPAVMRAGVMGGLVVLERWISRKAYMLNAFLLTGAIMLLFNPLLLLYDVGFQLSFVATIAVITLTKPLSTRLKFLPETLGLREAFAGSLAAIALTTPIILWHFGELSIIAPFVNLLA
ncbi:MAG: ComEC/Rec2 family competence protein, partial [bacterium]|nr:ComEC/Rec2 family competence protein [bacterium]